MGIVGIPRYSLDGRFESIGGERLKVENAIIKRNKTKMPTNPKTDFLDAEHISSGAMIFKEEVRKDFQFDSRYLIGFGDIDKDMQLLNSKWRKVVCLKSKVFHERLWKSDPDYYDFRRNWIEIARSYARFRKKWGVRFPFKEHMNYMLIKPLKYPFDIMYRRVVRRYPFAENIVKKLRT